MNQPSAVELGVVQLRELVAARRYPEAVKAADQLLAEVPENRDVLYLCAQAQRLLGNVPAALKTLTALQTLHPRFSRLYQERGQCYVARKQAPQAIEAFAQAVRMNPALPVSWSMLEGLYRMSGQTASAAAAACSAVAFPSKYCSCCFSRCVRASRISSAAGLRDNVN